VEPRAGLGDMKFKLKLIYDKQLVGQSVLMWRPYGTCAQFFFLLEISFRQLRVCYFVAPSLTRGRVCNLLYNYFRALPEQSLLGRSPSELTAIFYCLYETPPNLEGQVPCIYIPQEQGGPVIPPGTGFPFCRLLRLAVTTVEVFNPPPHWVGRYG
jgi:hypothetical protein